MEIKTTQLSIASARVNSGYTQEALAIKLGVSTKAIGDWENKRVPIKPLYVYAIAYVLKIPADQIRV